MTEQLFAISGMIWSYVTLAITVFIIIAGIIILIQQLQNKAKETKNDRTS